VRHPAAPRLLVCVRDLGRAVAVATGHSVGHAPLPRPRLLRPRDPPVRAVLLRARESFWFFPALLGVVAIVAAELLVAVDRGLIGGGTVGLPFLDALSASGGRSLLSIIGSSMLTVAGTSFSITISVLATTSSTYGPRLVRNFMADRANQLVLAAFTSTFLYAIVVMRSVHTEVDGADAFVPLLAVHGAVLLGVVDVGVLVFFIHHIATSVQITSLQQQVLGDLRTAADLAYPASPGDRVETEPQEAPRTTAAVRTDRDGYVQAVDWPRLVRVAADADTVVVVRSMPGSWVIVGDELVGTTTTASSATATAIRACVTLGSSRTPHQDVGYALQQLVEIAVRGLASGTNDPYTAVSALDMSTAVLVPVWRGRDRVTGHRDADGTLRVVVGLPSVESLVDSVVAGVETYGADQPAVVAAARRLVGRLRDVSPERRLGTVDELERRLAALPAAVAA